MAVVFPVRSGKMIGKYCAQQSVYDATGNRKYVSGFGDTKEDAMLRLGANLERRKKPKAMSVTRDRTPKRTLRQLLVHWQDANKGKLAAENLLRSGRTIENHLPDLLDKPLVELTGIRLKHEFAALAQRTVQTPTAYRNTYRTLRILLNYAIRQGWLRDNPLRLVDNLTVESKVAKNDEALVEERIEIYTGLLKWLRDKQSDDYYWVLFMSLGLRGGELCGLELDSIESFKSILTVNRAFRFGTGGAQSGISAGTKTGKARRIKLPELYKDAWVEWCIGTRFYIDPVEPWAKKQLFPWQHKDGTWHGRNRNRLYADFEKLLDDYAKTLMNDNGQVQLGLATYDWADLRFRPHYVRHISASLLAEQDVPLLVTQSVLGHLSPEMTERYTHISGKVQKSALDKATALFN